MPDPGWEEALGFLTVGSYWFSAIGLAAFGLYYLAIVALRSQISPTRPPPSDDGKTFVTVQIPVRNERYVVERVLRSVARLDWPRDRLEIQVLDDSNDDTSAIVEDTVADLRQHGLQILVHRRDDHEGHKAGALNHGLARARGTVIALFDADFVPPSGFLQATVPRLSPPDVACVQTRWNHLNESHSWLTRSLALALDAHFAVEQEVRSRYGLLLSFNATACVWKRSALEEVGGFPTATLTEDLDLTLRVMQTGRRLEYLDSPRVPCEIPVEILGFARQQSRWARGGVQNLRLHMWSLLRQSRLSFWQRVDALFHLAHYSFQPLLFLLFISGAAMTLQGRDAYPPATAALAILAGLGPLLLLIQGQRLTHARAWPLRLWRILPLTLTGFGICFRVTIAFFQGFRGPTGRFSRTPKYAITERKGSWRGTAYVPRTDLVTWLEGVLAVFAATIATIGFVSGRLAWAGSVAPFGAAFGWVFLQSMLERRPTRGVGTK